MPAWLIAGGADASAEAVLGLAAYRQAGAPATTAAAHRAATRSARASRRCPRGGRQRRLAVRRDHAVDPLPSLGHAWGGLAPAAVATASEVLDDPALLAAAVQDTAQFTPQLLAAGGPDNAWSPTPGEAQIAYGVDSRLQSLVATAEAAEAPGLLNVAAITAGWYFGANRSGLPAYDPATGTAVDGIERDGRVNLNSGAESTIHALLSMLVLDAHPELKAAALGITPRWARTG